MQKKALVFAVSAVFLATGAFAQKKGGDKEEKADPDSVVELYGKIYPEIVRERGSGATATSVTRCTSASTGQCLATFAAAATGSNTVISKNEIESSNSRLGVRGSEKLGGGLKAIFQLETIFAVDQNNSAFAARDSFVGLTSARWGTIKLGRMDTPFKGYADDVSMLGVSSGNFTSTSAINRRFAFGTSNSARFHERRTNVVDYETPELGGFQAEVQYSNGVAGGAGDEQDTATRKPHTWSAGIKWERGPFEISFGHEIHWDLFGLSRNVAVSSMANTNDQSVRSKDRATEVMVKFKWGIHQFEVDANRKEWKESATTAGRAKSYKNNSYLAIWDARWSPQWRTQIHFVRGTAGSCEVVGQICRTDGLEGTQVSAGVAYYFSKRTWLFFMAQWLKNDYSAAYFTGAQNASTGEDITQYAVGIHHSF
jgi:predicted porin